MRRPLVAGNWKMHGSRERVALLLQELKQACERVEVAELAVFPPFVFIDLCEQLLLRTQIAWGAQNVGKSLQGAFTGEISAEMLIDFHCTYVIVGHSERRQLFGESNEIVSVKFWTALNAGLCPILCVGETESERANGQTLPVVQQQLAAVLNLHDNLSALTKMVIAYEPVWAIGTGQHASPEQVQTVHAAIRKQLAQHHVALADKVRVLYGGSVKPDNAASLLAMPDVDGGLIGGASLNAQQFLEIGLVCNNLS